MPESDVILEADGLRVVFFRRGDRYAHRIELIDVAKNQWQTAYESLEGEPGDEWPPSPPFQQLHVERRTTGMVVLLIGMAGRTHWSAAVEVAVDRKSIMFDVAARVQVAPQKLGSEYAESGAAGLSPLARSEGMEKVVGVSGIVLKSIQTIRGDGHRVAPLVDCVAPATISWNYLLLLTPAS